MRVVREISELRYQTAWTPVSDGVLEALSQRWPALDFEAEWFECGCQYAGGKHVFGTATAADYEEAPHKCRGHWETREYKGRRGG